MKVYESQEIRKRIINSNISNFLKRNAFDVFVIQSYENNCFYNSYELGAIIINHKSTTNISKRLSFNELINSLNS